MRPFGLLPRLPLSSDDVGEVDGGASPPVRAASFDSGQPIRVRYRRRPQTTVRAASFSAPTGFVALVREVMSTGAGTGIAPREVGGNPRTEVLQAFGVQVVPLPESKPRVPVLPPAPVQPVASRPPTPVPVGSQLPTSATVPPAAPLPPLPDVAANPEERLRAAWAVSDSIPTATALSTDGREVAGLNALRAELGQAPIVPTVPPMHAAPSRSSAPSPGAAKAPAEAEEVSEPAHPTHDLFDRLGETLSYATTFDAGEFSLAKRFAQLDAALDREHGRASASPRADMPRGFSQAPAQPVPPVVGSPLQGGAPPVAAPPEVLGEGPAASAVVEGRVATVAPVEPSPASPSTAPTNEVLVERPAGAPARAAAVASSVAGLADDLTKAFEQMDLAGDLAALRAQLQDESPAPSPSGSA